MEHKTLQVKAQTLTDRGEFTALAATYSVDRVGDQIIPGAFKGTIKRWQESGKPIPLHWDHQGSPHDIIGTVDPAAMKEMDVGLFVKGQLDLDDSELAKEAWRSIKKNALALSFGYLATKERKREDGINELLEIDLFEVSVVPAPANPDTKFLSFKSAEIALEQASAVEDGGDEEPEKAKSVPQDPLVKEAWELVLPKPTHKAPEPEPTPEPEPLDPVKVQGEAWALVLKNQR